MRTFGTLLLLALASTAISGEKIPDTNKGHTRHQYNGYGHRKGETNARGPTATGPGSNVHTSVDTRVRANAQSQATGGQASAVGQGGSSTAIGLGSLSVGENTTGPVTAQNSIQGVQGGSATVNVTAGQPGASVAIDNGDSVWLPQVWRPNAILTPWCPYVTPVEGYGPVEIARPEPGDYPEVRFWFGGKWYVIQ